MVRISNMSTKRARLVLKIPKLALILLHTTRALKVTLRYWDPVIQELTSNMSKRCRVIMMLIITSYENPTMTSLVNSPTRHRVFLILWLQRWLSLREEPKMMEQKAYPIGRRRSQSEEVSNFTICSRKKTKRCWMASLSDLQVTRNYSPIIINKKDRICKLL